MHEIVGVIVESRSQDLAVGDRVAGYATDARGFSQYFINSGTQLFPVTSHLSDRDLVVVQPLATVLNAFSRVGNVAGHEVAVIGQGPLGLLWSHVLKSAGAARVVGVDQVDRSDVARAFGVDRAVWDISANWAASLKAEERYRLVVEAVGHQVGTLNDAISAVAFEGHVSAFGVPDDPYYPIAFLELFRKNASLTSGITSDWRRFLRDALEYLERHPDLPGSYITHEFSPVEAQRAYECASRPAAGRLKVVVVAGA
jgi:L-iditol 2-dehydrogenase